MLVLSKILFWIRVSLLANASTLISNTYHNRLLSCAMLRGPACIQILTADEWTVDHSSWPEWFESIGNVFEHCISDSTANAVRSNHKVNFYLDTIRKWQSYWWARCLSAYKKVERYCTWNRTTCHRGCHCSSPSNVCQNGWETWVPFARRVLFVTKLYEVLEVQL